MSSFLLTKTENTNSSTILLRIAVGDKTAVRESVDNYGNLVWAIARKYTNSTGEAEAAVHLIFREIWQRAFNYDAAKSDERTWIACVARRILINSSNKQFYSAAAHNENSRFEANQAEEEHPQIYSEIRKSVNI